MTPPFDQNAPSPTGRSGLWTQATPETTITADEARGLPAPSAELVAAEFFGVPTRHISTPFLISDHAMPSPTDILDLRHQPHNLFDSPESLIELLGDDERGPLVAALTVETPALLDRATALLAATSVPAGREAASRWIAVAAAAEDPELDDRIDDVLDDPERGPVAVDGLLRADAHWYHDALASRLDSDAAFGAAWLLSRSAPGELEEALVELDSPSRLLDGLRAASLAGAPGWFAPLLEWREHLADELDDRQLDGVDAALATSDPTAFVRRALAGDLDVAWLADDRAVADFLAVHGVPEWCHSLAMFRQVRDLPAFELCAAFAVCSALTEPFDDIDDEQLATGDPDRWLRDDPSKTALPLAIADDDDFAPHLVEATIHHALRRRGLQPPAMTGLPLSGPPVDADGLDDAFGLFDGFDADHPRDRVALVRTLTDLVTHARRGDVARDDAVTILERFSDDVDAARSLLRAVEDRRPTGRVDDWGCRGLHRLLWMSTPPSTQGLRACADGWFCGPVERAPAARAFFAASLPLYDDRVAYILNA